MMNASNKTVSNQTSFQCLLFTEGQTGNRTDAPSKKPTTERPHPPPFNNRPPPHYPLPGKEPTSSTVGQQADQVVFSINQPQASSVSSEQTEDNSMIIILLVFGSVILLLVVAISIVAIMIVVHKYQSRRQKAWAHLDEKQKVERMKQTGYINPTYQFFDQVTK